MLMESSEEQKQYLLNDLGSPPQSRQSRSLSENVDQLKNHRHDSVQQHVTDSKSFNRKKRSASALAETIKVSTKMTQQEQAMLNKVLSENSDETIRRRLVEKYNAYYRHWVDFNILVAIFAMVALFLGVLQWETQFENRGPDGTDISTVGFVTDFVVLLISVMGMVAIILKYYFESIWQNYKNPVAFYKSIVQRQVELGMVNEEDLTENFKTEPAIKWMVKQYSFWLELLLMIIVPIPFKTGGISTSGKVIYIDSINWIDNSGAYDSASHVYRTPYLLTDFYLAFMFFRFYFFALAIIMFSPINERLHGKRVCQNAGFEPNFSFQLKAGMKNSPILTFFLLSSILIFCLSFMIRIFERPYFTFNFAETDLEFYNFKTLSSALWYSIITMSSVGYGNIIATTPVGRGVTLVTAIVGAFLLSLLVAIITDWFIMEETQAEAIGKMQRDQFAVESLRRAFQYNRARAKRYRLLYSGNEENEHIPTVNELKYLKRAMYDATDRFKTVSRMVKKKDQEQVNRERTTKILKQQVLDLHDKFDYFVCMMLKGNKVPLEDIAERKKDKKREDRPQLLRQSTGRNSLADEYEDERAELMADFTNFMQNAQKANLGSRDAIRAEQSHKVDAKRLGTAWLEELALLQTVEEETEKSMSNNNSLIEVQKGSSVEKPQGYIGQSYSQIKEDLHENSASSEAGSNQSRRASSKLKWSDTSHDQQQ